MVFPGVLFVRRKGDGRMTSAEKYCLRELIREFKELDMTNDQIYERIKITLKPLTPERYQKRIKFICEELGI